MIKRLYVPAGVEGVECTERTELFEDPIWTSNGFMEKDPDTPTEPDGIVSVNKTVPSNPKLSIVIVEVLDPPAVKDGIETGLALIL